MTDYCFANLFQDWTALTEAPALPATTLADYYSGMFQGCTGLTQPPALPATARPITATRTCSKPLHGHR